MMRMRATVGVAAATPLLFGASVYAAETETKSSRKVKITQLPIYGEPAMRDFEYVPFEETVIMKPPYDVITVVRQSVAGVVYSIKERTDKMFKGLENTVPHVTDFLRYVQQDSGVVAKAAVISTGGLLGLGLGAIRGGASRRFMYTAVGLTTATGVCYPKQAVDIGRQAWSTLRDNADKAEAPIETPVANKAEEVASVKVEVAEKPSETIDPTKVDHGMSKAEDQDMYTTRE